MFALSIMQPYAEQIAKGTKKIEYRTWRIAHRGPLLVVASKGTAEGYAGEPTGVAVCIVDVVDITGEPDDYKWHLRDPRRVKPLAVKGYAKLYHVDESLLERVDGEATSLTPLPSTSKGARAANQSRGVGASVASLPGRQAPSPWSAEQREVQAAQVRDLLAQLFPKRPRGRRSD